MDLVEIRKKAKSRKKKEEKQSQSESKQEEMDPAADPDSSSEDLISDVVEEISMDPEITQKVQNGATPVEEKAISRKTVDQVSDSLTSLKGVLMSQQEDEDEDEEEQLQLLVFLLGQEEYALNIMDIKEIIRPKEITEVPKAPDYIRGILSLRGMIIPVMDVNKRLGLPIQERGNESRIVVVKWREHLFGLFVDGVVQVINLPLAKIEPPPEILGGVEGEFLRGVGKVDERLIILLNLVRVLALEEEEMPEPKQLVPENDE